MYMTPFNLGVRGGACVRACVRGGGGGGGSRLQILAAPAQAVADVLVVQNSGIEGPGNLGRLLEQDGFAVRTVHAKRERIPADLHSVLVVLGGPESANDRLPHLRDEQRLVRRYVEDGRPVLGICLGAQLVARAFGARVFRGPGAEVGFYHDVEPEPGPGLFSGFSSPFSVFHWHRDTFELPGSAVRLARSGQYPNQAFRIGSAVGLQFHFEVSRRMVSGWLESAGDGPGGIPGAAAQKIRDEADACIPGIESNMERFYRNFKSEFGL